MIHYLTFCDCSQEKTNIHYSFAIVYYDCLPVRSLWEPGFEIGLTPQRDWVGYVKGNVDHHSDGPVQNLDALC